LSLLLLPLILPLLRLLQMRRHTYLFVPLLLLFVLSLRLLGLLSWCKPLPPRYWLYLSRESNLLGLRLHPILIPLPAPAASLPPSNRRPARFLACTTITLAYREASTMVGPAGPSPGCGQGQLWAEGQTFEAGARAAYCGLNESTWG